MAQQPGTEPTYLVSDEITGQQALEQARAAQIVTRRRWPAVRSAVSALREIGCEDTRATPPPVQTRIA